jgi:predicted nucleic acid-binding protein
LIVLDASAAVELLLRTATGARVADRIAPDAETLHAPHLLDLEVAQVLRRYEKLGDLTADAARRALSDFGDLRIERYRHDLLLSRVWELRANATAYDAAYLALAEAISAPLLTADRKLSSLPGHRASIEVVP